MGGSPAVVWTPDMDATLKKLALSGEGDRIAAELIGVDRHTCRHRRKALGLPHGATGRPKTNAGRDARILHLIATLPIRVVAERMGVSVHVVRTVKHRARRAS